ncbi:uncharacterized protein LOC105913459 [Setaria italica]|uniref:Uncharacterized protein n=1 Tax=Setaria italica TaxID=4555 RepID=K3YAR2_SETIT|nr:uncharacterized protein LOC105913459 [Setaria italica]
MTDILGDFEARDPFPEEIESKFGEKALGNVETLHQILIPTLSALSLAHLPLQPGAEPLSLDQRRVRRRRPRPSSAAPRGRGPTNQQLQVRGELSTLSTAGDSLTINDYILAARIDKVKTLDLIPKKRVWA